MPKHHEYWTCGICGVQSDTLEEAEACEAQGLPVVPPIGTIIQDGSYLHGSLLLSVVARKPHDQHLGAWHSLDVGTWIWRDEGEKDGRVYRSSSGDTTPEGRNTCSGTSCRPYPSQRPGASGIPFTVEVDRESLRYHRCWQDMQRLGLPLYFWAEGKAVPAEPPLPDIEALALVPLEDE